MRKKNSGRRDHVLLIRVNKKEKNLAEMNSKASGENVSEFFRRLLREEAGKDAAKNLECILNNHRETIKEYREILAKMKKTAVYKQNGNSKSDK